MAAQEYVQTLQRVRALQGEKRWAEAEAALGDALAAWPRDRMLLVQSGVLAQTQSHWAEAAARYDTLRAQHPDYAFAWARCAEMLRMTKRADEAEALLADAVVRFPAHHEVLLQWVLSACDRRQWQEAELRAEQLMLRLPDEPATYRVAAEAFVRQGRFLEAEQLVAEGLHRLGVVPVLTLRFAELATLRKDWPAAARRWAAALRHLPDVEAAHRGLALALRELDDATAQRGVTLAARLDGPLADVESVLTTACQRFPDSTALAVEHAWSASARGDWPVAVARWEALSVREPSNPRIRQGLENALLQAGSAPPAAGAPGVAPILMRFESLGVSCELGLAQRRAGVEPLSLLRFAGITLDKMITALDTDLAGFGEPEFTEVYLRDGEEYMIRDTRYGLNMHTFTGPGQVSQEQFTRGTYARLRFLARKLRDDLHAADKIFVRRVAAGGEPREQHARLLAALRRHGDNTLLLVEDSDDPRRLGRTEWLAPGLMLGWINNSSPARINYDLWASVCSAAHGLWSNSAVRITRHAV